jgi:uroporphyrinogen-III synthase
MNAERTLEGMGIVLTRPLDQSRATAARLEPLGATVFVFPALAIVDPPDAGTLDRTIAELDKFSLGIFVSANAVERGLGAARSRRAWPAGLKVAAVGGATAQALRDAGHGDVIVPTTGADSEALLAMPQLQSVEGQNIIVFRGEGGRELIAEVLTGRGARVTCLTCYRRVRPEGDPRALLAAWRSGKVDAVSAMSAESLANFLEMVGTEGRTLMQSTPLLVPHPRVAERAHRLGLDKVAVTDAAAEGLADALAALAESRKKP